jgi:rRNA-processing protein FCF1
MNDRHEAHLYIPRDVYRQLKTLADKNRRTVNAEITIAIEAHVKPRKNGAKK